MVVFAIVVVVVTVEMKMKKTHFPFRLVVDGGRYVDKWFLEQYAHTHMLLTQEWLWHPNRFDSPAHAMPFQPNANVTQHGIRSRTFGGIQRKLIKEQHTRLMPIKIVGMTIRFAEINQQLFPLWSHSCVDQEVGEAGVAFRLVTCENWRERERER